jgi:hypothetical protein
VSPAIAIPLGVGFEHLALPKLQLVLRCAQVLAARGVKQVTQFSSGELADIRAAADRVRQQQQQKVQQLGLPARLLRFAIRQVGKRLVTAPLMLIPGAVQPEGLTGSSCASIHALLAYTTSSLNNTKMSSGGCRRRLGCLCVH